MNYEVRIYEANHYMGASDHYDLTAARTHCQDVIIGLGPDRVIYRQDIINKSTSKAVEVVR